MTAGSINPVSGQSAQAGSGAVQARAKGTTLDYDAFLKLLMAQMKNQDPLEPMKSSDYVAQLASFSQVEKAVQISDGISSLLSVSRLQQAEGLIGKTITSADGTTAGTVVASRLAGSDVIAVLGDGSEVTVGPGITLRGA